jgi:transposase InsO family protein
MRYAFIHAHVKQFPIAVMCRVLKVSRSGCYAAHNRPLSLRSCEDLALRARIAELHEAHRQAPGVIKMWHLLRNKGVVCGRNRVARLRQIGGIETRRTRRFKNMRVYQKVQPPAPDLVQRGFTVEAANKIWVGDMTFLTTRSGSVCLAVYIDLCTHCVTGWAMAPTATAKLAVSALQNGIDAHQPTGGIICHTDQGSVYASALYREYLADNQMHPSMSRKGNCHDNAVAESFFSNLKNELTHHYTYDDAASAEVAIGDYIDVYYNQQRLHQSLDYRTPAQVQALHR